MLLPPPPLRLKSSFVWKNLLGGLTLVLAGVAAAIGFAWWQYGVVNELLEQSRIWKDGVEALSSEVKGHVTTHKFILNEYDLDVTYVDADQISHQAKAQFDTLFGKVDQETDPIVHYLKNDPDRFALSWAMDVKISRWGAIVFMALLGIGLIGGGLTVLGLLTLRRLSEARRCASRSDELVVQVTGVVPQMHKGRHVNNEYHYTGQTIDGRTVAGKIVLPIKHEPLFADSAKKTMLVLVTQENVKRPVVVRGDFYPFELTAEEQGRTRQVIASRSTPAA